MRGAFIKNTDCTDAHGWVFSRIIYSCSAAHCLVLMRSRRNGLPRIFRMRRVVWENVTRWACLVCEKSVEIREICGQQISAQFAKEQAECIYSPTDRTRRFSQKPCGVPLSKKHETRRSPTDRRGGNCTDAHGWGFSRIIYSCSAAHCLVLDAPPAQRIDTLSHAESGL